MVRNSSSVFRSVRSGFTLIELMIVISIMAVVMTVGIPSIYRNFSKDSIREATQDVLDIFQHARARAIMSGQAVQLVIRPQERVFIVMPLEQEEGMTEQEFLATELEETMRTDELLTEEKPPVRDQDTMMLSNRMTILFVGVNIVPDLQESEMVPVRFYPNGTSDEFSMVIVSDSNESRLFQLDVPTGLLDWKIP